MLCVYKRLSLVLVLLSLAPHALLSTSLLEEDLSESSREARWIGHVIVREVKTLKSGDMPTTEIRGEIRDVFKGSGQSGDLIRAWVPGGMKNSTTMVSVMGLPVFQVDQEYVLFLTQDPLVTRLHLSSSDAPELVGWTAYRVFRDARSQKMVMRQGCFMKSGGKLGTRSLRAMPDHVEGYEAFVDRLQRDLH